MNPDHQTPQSLPQQNNLPAPADGALRNMILDAETLHQNVRESEFRFIKTSCDTRNSLLRDTLAIIITVLLGAMTYYTVAPHLVKTPVLFFLGVACLFSGTIVNMLSRAELIRHLQQVTAQIEFHYTKVMTNARNFKIISSDTNRDALVAAEYETVQLDKLRWVGDKGYELVIVLAMAGLVIIGLALLFRISWH